jgi:hypothetical protein
VSSTEDTEDYERAAGAYRQAGYDYDAARCYRLAGAHRRAAEIYESLGDYAQAAAAYSDAGLPELGAWLLVDVIGDPAGARALLGSPHHGRSGDAPSRRYDLVVARCEIAEGAPADSVRSVIGDVRAALADRTTRPDLVEEEWAVALSVAAARYDLAALVFAAAVRGGRYGAAQRWNSWSRNVLGADFVLPRPATAA